MWGSILLICFYVVHEETIYWSAHAMTGHTFKSFRAAVRTSPTLPGYSPGFHPKLSLEPDSTWVVIVLTAGIGCNVKGLQLDTSYNMYSASCPSLYPTSYCLLHQRTEHTRKRSALSDEDVRKLPVRMDDRIIEEYQGRGFQVLQAKRGHNSK